MSQNRKPRPHVSWCQWGIACLVAFCTDDIHTAQTSNVTMTNAGKQSCDIKWPQACGEFQLSMQQTHPIKQWCTTGIAGTAGTAGGPKKTRGPVEGNQRKRQGDQKARLERETIMQNQEDQKQQTVRGWLYAGDLHQRHLHKEPGCKWQCFPYLIGCAVIGTVGVTMKSTASNAFSMYVTILLLNLWACTNC